MKLKHLKQKTNERLLEFDTWITPTLEEISDTDKYNSELEEIKQWLDILALENDDFSTPSAINSKTITNGILRGVSELEKSEKISRVTSAASLLFLVTGKSDNNCKCQFPIYLRDVSHKDYIPKIKTKGSKKILLKGDIPREIKSTRIAKVISDISDFPEEQEDFLHDYIQFILDKEKYLNSFWSIGHSYMSMKKLGLENELLMPLVVFKVRGSVSASGGHDPEHLLKDLMTTWGMQPAIDFNTTDVIIGIEKTNKKVKTRAYDFILPFAVKGWNNKIFIQCQFYAGDSGSVSHKNVDQTRASREFTKTKIESPIFVEYLDGAGYFSSLNGDLKSILAMDDTHDFFQIKSAPLKLRKNLQQIGFLTIMELAHALSINIGKINPTIEYLLSTGYAKNEIDRILESAIEQGVIKMEYDKESAIIDDLFFNHSRRYFLLDQIYNFSQKLTPNEASLGGLILVPGLPGFHGIKLSEIVDKIIPESGLYKTHFESSSTLLKDIEYLSNNKWIINH